MSKASEWARRFDEAIAAKNAVGRERPDGCPEVYIADVGWFGFRVTDTGYPEIVLPKGIGAKLICGDNGLPRLIDMARWILDNFGEPTTPPAEGREGEGADG